MQDNQKLAYRVNAAAAALDISRSKLYDLMKHGEVGYVCIGTVRRIPYSEIVRISTNGIPGTKAGIQAEDDVHPTTRRHLKR
jgi:excisionase family DNA binding protein